jgi:hypothetical protein
MTHGGHDGWRGDPKSKLAAAAAAFPGERLGPEINVGHVRTLAAPQKRAFLDKIE